MSRKQRNTLAWRTGLRGLVVIVLCVALAVPALPQSLCCSGNIGPSKGEVIGIIAGAAAAIGVGGYLIYRASHKYALIQGCVTSGQNGLSLQNEKDKKTYALSGDSSALRAGQRLVVRGKKQKDSSGKVAFQVQKVQKDLGECLP